MATLPPLERRGIEAEFAAALAAEAPTVESLPAAPDEPHFNVTRCRYAEM